MSDSFHALGGLAGDRLGTVATVGTFDGVHRGHRLVLDRLARRARESGLRSALVTFSPHPLDIVRPASAPAHLTTADEKTEVLADTRIDYVVVVPFTTALAQYDARQFVTEVLLKHVGMKELFVGYDHGFGRDRAGSPEVLQRLGSELAFGVTVVPPVAGKDGTPISSTAIRAAVAAGDLVRAADGLARPYSLSGIVVLGTQRGRALGFRTINLAPPPPRKLLPPEGVYAIRAITPTGKFGGMLNLGPRPTFGERESTIEAHLFDAEGDWYGARVLIEFLSRLRDTRKFDGPAELARQLRADEQMARVIISRGAGFY